jgi:hypothetical protein
VTGLQIFHAAGAAMMVTQANREEVKKMMMRMKLKMKAMRHPLKW